MKVINDILCSYEQNNINNQSINTKGNLRGLPLLNLPLDLAHCILHKNNLPNLNKVTLANRNEMMNASEECFPFIKLTKFSSVII